MCPDKNVFIGRKGSSGRTPRQFDYFALRGGDIISIGSRLWRGLGKSRAEDVEFAFKVGKNETHVLFIGKGR